jgi:hypothetical protein
VPLIVTEVFPSVGPTTAATPATAGGPKLPIFSVACRFCCWSRRVGSDRWYAAEGR